MKRHIFTTLLLIHIFAVGTVGQTLHQDEYFILDEEVTGNHIYEARDSIKLRSGFHTSSVNDQSFHANINPYLVFPPEDGENGGPEPEDDGVVGTIPGKFKVTNTGAATYKIPLELPKGRSGMKPQISINYNSLGNNGIMTKGWSLSGISTLSRTPYSQYYNDSTYSIDLSEEDQLKLNGQHLIELPSGEYRTENESYTRIVPVDGNINNGFIVYKKNGRIYEYGTNENSRLYLQDNPTPVSWSVTKIKDRQGNYIDFNYLNQPANGFITIKTIEYTGNAIHNNDPFYKIEFSYQANNNAPKKYFPIENAAFTKNIKTLDKISVEYTPDNSVIKTYDIIYDSIQSMNVQQVSHINLTGKEDVHYNSTDFEWTKEPAFDSGLDYQSFQDTLLNNSPNFYKLFASDLNLDASNDLLVFHSNYFSSNYNSNYCEIKFYKKSSTEPESWLEPKTYETNIPYDAVLDASSADINGDRRNDLAVFYKNEGYIRCKIFYLKYNDEMENFIVNKSNELFEHQYRLDYYSAPVFTVNDYNADGLKDCYMSYEYSTPNIRKGILFTSEYENPFENTIYNDYQYEQATQGNFLVGDYDGDLRNEIMVVGDTETVLIHYEKTSNGPRVYITNPNVDFTNSNIKTGDFNSDGRADIISFDNYSDTCRIYHSYQGEGYEFNLVNSLKLTNDLSSGRKFEIDINNDKHTDIRQIHTKSTSEGNREIWIKKFIMNKEGDDFENIDDHLVDSLNTYCFDYNNIVIGDFNAKGYKGTVIPIENKYNSDNCNGTEKFLTLYKSGDRPKLKKVTNGNGKKVYNINYQIFADRYRYEINRNCHYPVANFSAPMKTVATYKISNNKYELRYAGAREHLGGKGFLGFNKFTKINYKNDVETTYYTGYDTTYYHVTTDSIIQKAITDSSSYYLKKAYNDYKIKSLGDKRYNAHLEKSVSKSYNAYGDFVNTQMKKVFISDYTYGRVDSVHKFFDKENLAFSSSGNQYDYFTKENYTYYEANESEWIINLMKDKISKKYSPDDPSVYKKQQHIDYYSNATDHYPLKEQVIKVPPEGEEELKMVTSFKYNDYGNVIKKTESAPNSLTSTGDRITNYNYNADYHHRFLTKKWHTLDDKTFSVEKEYYVDIGKVKTEKSVNDLTTTYYYDNMGRLTKKETPNGVIQETARRWVQSTDNDAPEESIYYTWKQTSAEAPVKIYYDTLGRKLRKVKRSFSGDKIYVDVEYTNRGNVARKSNPYFKGESPVWMSYEYNRMNQKTKIIKPHDVVHRNYTGNSLEITSENNGLIKKKSFNALGEVDKVEDKGGTIRYKYYSSGKTHKIITDGHTITQKFDANGNMIYSNDPDAGEYHYLYNAFGEKIKTTYPNGKTDSLIYDKMGRVVTKLKPEGTINYNYDNAENGLGKISSITGYNGIDITYSYDEYGKVKEKKETIDGENYITGFSYDEFGRLNQKTFPSGLKTEYEYNDYGYQKSTGIEGMSEPIKEIVSKNEFGKVTSFETGNGWITTHEYDNYGYPEDFNTHNDNVFHESYTFDYAKGVLTDRYNLKNNLSVHEHFEYDALDRLTDIMINGDTIQSMQYADNGNITEKTDAGSYTYGDNNASPHAVTKVTNDQNTIPHSNQSINYTSFNKISAIGEGSDSLQITYGHNNKRRITRYFENENQVKKKIHLTSGIQKLVTDSTNKYIHFLNGAVVVTDMSGNNQEIYYTYNDYLGSIRVVAKGTEMVSEVSFDPWGRRRNPRDWLYDDTTYSELPFDIGYTGHEHYERFGLINMNGRTYDPVLGRFLSPDPYTQFPESTQNYNRYSYGLNNPLRFTDPSGYNVWDKIEKGLDWGARMFLNRITIPGRVFSGMVGYTNDQINDNESQFGYFNAEYILYGATSMKDIEWSNFLAAAKNNIKRGKAPYGNMQDNFATYDRLHQQYVMDYYSRLRLKRRRLFYKGLNNLGINNSSESVPTNDKFLLKATEKWYPEAPLDKTLNYTVEDVPQKHIRTLNKNDALGMTGLAKKGSKELSGYSNVYFSERAFNSAKRLFYTIGGEMVHVSQHWALRGESKNLLKDGLFLGMMEYWEYSYRNNLGKNFKARGFNPAIYMNKYPDFYEKLNYMNFDWTSNSNFKYPF